MLERSAVVCDLKDLLLSATTVDVPELSALAVPLPERSASARACKAERGESFPALRLSGSMSLREPLRERESDRHQFSI